VFPAYQALSTLHRWTHLILWQPLELGTPKHFLISCPCFYRLLLSLPFYTIEIWDTVKLSDLLISHSCSGFGPRQSGGRGHPQPLPCTASLHVCHREGWNEDICLPDWGHTGTLSLGTAICIFCTPQCWATSRCSATHIDWWQFSPNIFIHACQQSCLYRALVTVTHMWYQRKSLPKRLMDVNRN